MGIGFGAFAIVRQCLRRLDNQMFAMKIIKKSNYKTEEELALLLNEVNAMRQLNHSNILSLHDVFENDRKLILILDYCKGQSLFDSIVENGAFTEANAKIIFFGLCKALSYLHSQNIVHRDIKIEDLLFRQKSDLWSITLTDFGLCGFIKNNEKLSKAVGTPNYVSPEVLNGEAYDTQADMWTAGVILFIALAGFQPFYDENNDSHKMYEKIKQAKYESMDAIEWRNVSENAKDCVRKLLQTDPSKRMTAEQTLRHPFLASLHNMESNALIVLGFIRSNQCDNDCSLPPMCPKLIANYYSI